MHCGQCGYDYAGSFRQGLAERLQDEARALAEGLAEVERLDERPALEVWSALEYACHVRDVLAVQRDRIQLALHNDIPHFEPMGREERVASYAVSDPSLVMAEITANATALRHTLETLDERGWKRTGIYNYPETAERSVEWIARHTIHELVHHHQDITAVGGGDIPG